MLFRYLLTFGVLTMSLNFLQGCQFMAGAATGVAATEVAEEVEDDDDDDD